MEDRMMQSMLLDFYGELLTERQRSCYDLHVSGTNIYDCSYLGAQLSYVTDALFTGCSVTDCGSDYGFNGFWLDNCSGVFFDDELLSDGEFRIGAAG